MTPDPKRPVGRPPAFLYKNNPAHGSSNSRSSRTSEAADELYCEDVPVAKLAHRYGTPLYLYSATAIRQRLREFDHAFQGIRHTVCYSIKANSNLSLLRLLSRLGCGFDVVSGNELQRVLKVDRRATRRVVFSGVGKTVEEIDLALKSGILLFNVESESELSRLAERASRLKQVARVALRVNPDVPAETHPYISTGLHEHKFGIPIEQSRGLYARAAKERFLAVAGVSVHIGSQITSPDPFGAAMQRVGELVRQLRADGHTIEYVDGGGGLGIFYEKSEGQNSAGYVARYATALSSPLRELNVHLLLEPGRAIMGPAGALIATVQYVKQNNNKRFLVADAAMNDLIRPSLYGAFHEIVPVRRNDLAPDQRFDVVGPICETGDFLARDRQLPEISEGELIAVLDVGAYGMSISSNYNSRSRAPEVLVDGKSVKLIRRRETFADLVRAEIV